MNDQIPGELAAMIFLVPLLCPLLFASKLLVLYFVKPSAKWQIWALPIALAFLECIVLMYSFRLVSELHHGALHEMNAWLLSEVVYFFTIILIDALALFIAKSLRPKLIVSLIAIDLAITPLIANVMVTLH